MARKPFALEGLISKPVIAQQRARDRYFKARAKEATKYLEAEIDKMQKEAEKKSGGVLGGFFGNLPGWAQTLGRIGLGATGPLGMLANLGLSVGDYAKQQKDIKRKIKELDKVIKLPRRFKGTFMEDYLRGNLMGGASQLQSNLKSQQKVSQLLGLGGIALQALPTFGAIGKQGLSVKLPEGLGKVARKGITTYKDGVANVTAGAAPKFNIPGWLKDIFKKPIEAGASIIDQGGVSSIAEGIGEAAGKGRQLLSTIGKGAGELHSKAGGIGVPFIPGLNFGTLMDPLVAAGPDASFLQSLGSEATRLMHYQPMLEGLLQDYLTAPAGEPVISELEAPRFYK
tara:strand:- start:1919 stop:2941 length:1023 start_codon:yes stop_codon:yes gene_type:complete